MDFSKASTNIPKHAKIPIKGAKFYCLLKETVSITFQKSQTKRKRITQGKCYIKI